MSLWSSDSLTVFYSPGEVQAASRSGRRLRKAARYPVADGADEPAPLAAFAAAVRESACRKVRVILSNHYVQYRVLPWRADLSGDAEYRALAQVQFADVFGGLAEGWTIGLSDEPPGRPRVAAAVPSEMLTALSAAAAECKTKIVSVRPYLAAVDALWTPPGDAAACWLVIVEPGRACAAVRQGATWRWLRHMRLPANWADRLGELMAAEALLAEAEAAPASVHVFAPGVGAQERASLAKSGYRLVETPSGGDASLVPAIVD